MITLAGRPNTAVIVIGLGGVVDPSTPISRSALPDAKA